MATIIIIIKLLMQNTMNSKWRNFIFESNLTPRYVNNRTVICLSSSVSISLKKNLNNYSCNVPGVQ